MRIASLFAALLGSAVSVSGLAIRDPNTTPDGYLKVRPGGIEDLIVSEETTLNGTYKGDEPLIVPAAEMKIAATLPFHFVNSFGAPINAYLTGTDDSGRVVFVRADGSLYYPSSGGSGVPVAINQNDIKISMAAGQAFDMTLPISMSSGRIYFAAGDLSFAVVATPIGEGIVQPAPNNPVDPSAGINWGFESFPQYLDMLQSQGVGPNVACFAGHSAIRTFVMGAEATERGCSSPFSPWWSACSSSTLTRASTRPSFRSSIRRRGASRGW